MLKVGITGGIGSGKTTICNIFEVLGIPVFYADSAAKSLMHTDELLKQGIREAFGDRSYNENGLDRKYLANIVFNDPVQLGRLNALVHPAVFREFKRWVANHYSHPYVMKEAALLFESDSYKLCDKSILVTAPLELKIARVVHRDTISEAEVKARMDKQFTDEQKLKLADHVITNDEKSLLIPHVIALHHQFLHFSGSDV